MGLQVVHLDFITKTAAAHALCLLLPAHLLGTADHCGMCRTGGQMGLEAKLNGVNRMFAEGMMHQGPPLWAPLAEQHPHPHHQTQQPPQQQVPHLARQASCQLLDSHMCGMPGTSSGFLQPAQLSSPQQLCGSS